MSHYNQQSQSNIVGKSARNRIHTITGAQVQSLIAKLETIKPFLPSSLPLRQLVSENDYTSAEVNGGGSGKHVLQECSILGNLRRITASDINNAPQIAVEIGAGTGRLSERLQRVTNCEMIHVMIDRQDFAPSQCRDGRMRSTAKDANSVQRIVEDVANLDLNQYCQDGCKCFCMSKHLCGPACDLAIAALERVTPPSNRPPFAFATCCHYLCTFDVFAGKEYWVELGLTEQDFEVAATVSQWYSLKRKTEDQSSEEHNNDGIGSAEDSVVHDYEKLISNASNVSKDDMKLLPSAVISSEIFERIFSNKDKSKLGEDVKKLLDMLRVAKLQKLGYNAEVVLYTNRSLENRLLLGALKTLR